MIRRFEPGEEQAVYELIKRVYDEFVAGDYSEAGNNFFYDWIEPSKIAARQADGRNIWVACEDSKLVGVVETRDNKFISLLFVEKGYQGRGIAKELFKVAVNEILKRAPATEYIYVHASPFSVPVYKRLGFTEAGRMTEENGIWYLPMEMNITNLKSTI